MLKFGYAFSPKLDDETGVSKIIPIASLTRSPEPLNPKAREPNTPLRNIPWVLPPPSNSLIILGVLLRAIYITKL